MPERAAGIRNRPHRLIAEIRARLGAGDTADLVESEGMANAARDFLAFGTVRWMLRDLTIAMGHSDCDRSRES